MASGRLNGKNSGKFTFLQHKFAPGYHKIVHMRSPRFILIVVVVALLIDLYVFQAIKTIAQGSTPRWRMIIFGLHWGIAGLALASFIAGPYLHFQNTRIN